MNPDGSGRTNLTNTTQDESSPAWSPDGTKIVFSRYEGGTANNLFLRNADGSGERRLTAGPGMRESPSWSPDGRHIVFAAASDCVREPTCARDLVILDVETLSGTSLTNDAERDYLPAWSPDGTRIAFTRSTGCPNACDPDIWTIRPDGSGMTRLTGPGNNDSDPSWSPDGEQIAYVSNADRGAAGYEIYRMNGDGSAQTRLTFASGAFSTATQPAWSPDGKRIAFIATPNGACSAYECGSEIFDMRSDGTDVTRLTTDRVLDQQPDWQPIPNRPPDCSNVTASPSVLEKANRKFVAVTLEGATDPDGDPVSVTVDGVTQDEPVRSRHDHTSPDAIDEGGGTALIRAERDRHGDGRVYRIAFTVSDGRGGSCSGTAKVSVPRKKRQPAVDSAPPSYDSFAR